MWGIIGTWAMAEEGIKKAGHFLSNHGSAMDACEVCVREVEKNPAFTSVGYGGLPNEKGRVSLDAAAMDGNTLQIGSVMGVEDFKHPSAIAKDLLNYRFNNVLVGKGAKIHGLKMNLKEENLLTEASKEAWLNHVHAVEQGLSPYDGHDTVCTVAVDVNQAMAAMTSTSGLFFKAEGRVGDAPLPGSGFYVDSEIGGAAATGLGEDIMKGILSYEIVRLMSDGLNPQDACERAVTNLHEKLTRKNKKAGDLSVIAMNHKVEFGAATNIDTFPFVVATDQHLMRGKAHFRASKHSQEIVCTKLL